VTNATRTVAVHPAPLVSLGKWKSVAKQRAYQIVLPDTAFGSKLRRARLDARLTQKELEARSGVRQNLISMYETGVVRDPAPETVTALELSLDLGPGDLSDDLALSAIPNDLPPGAIVIEPGTPELLDAVEALLLLTPREQQRVANAARLLARTPPRPVSPPQIDRNAAAGGA
jgi:transcriptional regulator with XRE-family HTH domain